MEGNRRKITVPEIISILLLLLGLIATIITLAAGDTLILYYGIKLYRALRTASVILLIAAAAFAVILIIRRISLQKKTEEQKAEEEARKEEQKRSLRQKDAKLSVKGELNAAAIREMLLSESHGRWAFATDLIMDCVAQMEQMDSYQDRLKHLLENNGADSLRDTEEILDEVEQYLCRNVRSVLNFMDVADSDAADQVRQKLLRCKDENQELLEKTRDFIYALAEFLNDQGGKADTRLLETYRTTILQSIH